MASLSVIIPIYNVEPYLAACLESVAAQTWQDLEVVMVDDGSTDAGAEIALRFAERDGRFRLVRQANAGLGAARNTGLRHATGEFITFLDSDDMLPLHALEHLLAALRRSGSDLATGNVQRFDGRRARQSAMHRIIFAAPATTTHISRYGVLLKDRLVTNKLWRRSFWDAHGFQFPEGVLYEDISVALRAHFLATSVDVLPTPVYLWRERDGASLSITQDKTHIRGLEDRFAAVTSVRRFLAGRGRGEPEVMEHDLGRHIPAWDHVVLDTDLSNYLNVMDQAGDAYCRRFLDLAGEYLDGVAPDVIAGLPAVRRLKWHLVKERRLADLLEVMAWERRVKPDDQVVRRRRHYYLNTPLLGRKASGVPAAISRLDAELSLLQRIDAARWLGGKLVIEGRVTPRHLRPTRRLHQQVFATLVQEGTGRRMRVPTSVTRTTVSPPSGKKGGKRGGRRDWAGFRLVVDPRRLVGRPRPSVISDAVWHVELCVVHRGLVRRARLADARAGWVRQVGCRGLGAGRHVAPLLTEASELVLRVQGETVRVVGQRVRNGRLRLVGQVVNPLGPEPVLLVSRTSGGVPLSYPITTDGRTFEVGLDLRDVLPARRLDPKVSGVEVLDLPVEWRVEVRTTDGTTRPVTLADDLPAARHGVAGREIVVTRDPSGGLVLVDQALAAFVDHAEWLAGGELLIEGGFAEPHRATHLVLTSDDRLDRYLVPLEGAGTRFRSRLAPQEVESMAGRLPLPRGSYGLAVRADGVDQDIPMEFDSDASLSCETARRVFEFRVDGANHAVLTVSSDLSRNERGKKAQRVLRAQVYPGLRGRPLRSAVFFNSHDGRRFSDSPRAIYEELRRRGVDLEFMWNVHDGQVALPSGIDPVRRHGREYFEALARCRYIVTNDRLPTWFERRPDQVVLQTWHGSALKWIGFDAQNVGTVGSARTIGDAGEAGKKISRHHERLAKEISQWSHLLSPSPWCTPVFREAFRFEGEVLETGLPRNDILHAPHRAEAAAEVRRRIGLPDGRKVVLYAPTRRDGAANERRGKARVRGKGRQRFDLQLDLEQMRSALGEDHVVLVRRHPGIVDRTPCVGTTDFVRDVSAYPDIQELYLVADVLITDYSSAMVDFAVTGRPILFVTCDMERWPGFYVDFEAEAPGPLLGGTDEVVDAIRDLDEVAAKHAGLYDAFVAKHCPLDDGQATSRVVDHIFGHLTSNDRST